MVRYISKPASVSTEEVSVDEKVVEYVSALYSIAEEAGMESEFTEVEIQGFDQSIEYFEATSLEYEELDRPQIQRVEMELELDDGEITAEYTDDSEIFEVNFPGDQRQLFEEELGGEFRMGARDRLRDTASSGFEALRNRKNRMLP